MATTNPSFPSRCLPSECRDTIETEHDRNKPTLPQFQRCRRLFPFGVVIPCFIRNEPLYFLSTGTRYVVNFRSLFRFVDQIGLLNIAPTMLHCPPLRRLTRKRSREKSNKRKEIGSRLLYLCIIYYITRTIYKNRNKLNTLLASDSFLSIPCSQSKKKSQ